jgi:hypothetical protein
MRVKHWIAFLGLLTAVAVSGFASDPVTDLQEKIRKKEVRLEFDGERGYLPALLKALNIPVSSQTLVFSKTSFQSEYISPSTPRALYFNDNVYAGWVSGPQVTELISVNSSGSAAFYLVGRGNDGEPVFERSTGHDCSVCHYSQESKTFVPQLSFLSVVPDATGDTEGSYPIPTDDRSPFSERWGGWYVTGTHGSQRHEGNTWRGASGPGNSQNVVDLKGRFDTSIYLSQHSDIVALSVLAHQVEVQNLISLAAAKNPPPDIGERLVKALLFSDAAPFTSPIRGTSDFTAEFTARGPKDTKGRSLRDFDLQTKLFRYPLSYMIYSDPFQGLGEPLKAYVAKRIKELLAGPDRAAVLEILHDTKPLPGF